MNNKANQGQRLKPALQRFARDLINEARYVSGLPYRELDEQLAPPRTIWDGQILRYATKDRAPLASGIQGLEDRTAKLVKRKARTVCVQYAPFGTGLGDPRPSKRIRRFSSCQLKLGYADGWPTFEDLTFVNIECPHSRMTLDSYFWQWGLLWDRGWVGLDRAQFGIPDGEPVESFVSRLVDAVEGEKAAYDLFAGTEPWADDLQRWQGLPSPDLRKTPQPDYYADLSCLDNTDADQLLIRLAAGNLPERISDHELWLDAA